MRLPALHARHSMVPVAAPQAVVCHCLCWRRCLLETIHPVRFLTSDAPGILRPLAPQYNVEGDSPRKKPEQKSRRGAESKVNIVFGAKGCGGI